MEEVKNNLKKKKASKRSASVAALAAITTSQEAETAVDEELFKPQQLEAKKKAVAIVRPQPQQPTQLQQPSQPKPSELKFPLKLFQMSIGQKSSFFYVCNYITFFPLFRSLSETSTKLGFATSNK